MNECADRITTEQTNQSLVGVFALKRPSLVILMIVFCKQLLVSIQMHEMAEKKQKLKTKLVYDGLQYYRNEAFTFLKDHHARGYKTGNNSCSPSQLQRAARVSKV